MNQTHQSLDRVGHRLHAEGMNPEALRVGDTYRVHIPRGDSPAEYVTGSPERAGVDLAFLQMALTHADGLADDFDITLTAVGEWLGAEPAVTGVKVVESAHISTPLAAQMAEALGLSPEVDYVVEGVLKDARSGEPVRLLAEQAITIPARWLRPVSLERVVDG